MRRGIWSDLELAGVVGNHAVATAAELEAAGVARSTVTRRCRHGGPWRRLAPGIVLLGNGFPTHRQRAIAAAKYAGPGAVVTGMAALQEFGHVKSAMDVHVVIPGARRVQSSGFVVVERTNRLPIPLLRNGIAYAGVDRAVIDAARRCGTVDVARGLIATIVQRGASTPQRLSDELEAGSRRGAALPRVVLGEVADNVHSVAEADARSVWQRSGLSEMVFNVDIVDEAGLFLARPDGWIDSVALAWEIDSREWHVSPADWAHTVDRRNRLQALGVIVLSTRPVLLRSNPAQVLEELRGHYRLAASRRRPPVRIRHAT